MKRVSKLIFVLFVLFAFFVGVSNSMKAIDNSRQDLGMLDSLKMTDQFGGVINIDGAKMVEGRTYTLLYKWSLDEPTSDYRNKTATFDIPSVFDDTTIFPGTIPLYYDDEGNNIQIGVISADTTSGVMTVQFNDNEILGGKSNIHGWISISAKCGSTLGNSDITIGWDGNNEDKITVNVVSAEGVGTNKTAILNKGIKSGKIGNQPIVHQNGDGKFYISFWVEVFTSQEYQELELKDTIFSGMEIDHSSIKITSRPKDGEQYYSGNGVYKTNFDTWKANNPSGSLAPDQDITAALDAANAISSTQSGFTIKFSDVSFESQLASRQLTTTPIQMRYVVEYDVFLTGVDPEASLEDAQAMFESQNAKNTVTLEYNDSIITDTEWNKGVVGAGAEGEVRDVTLVKVDSATQEEISGATFELYKQNAYNENLWELYKKDITMDNGSILVEDLVFGNYRFKEVVAPAGYILPETEFEVFKIDSSVSQDNFEIVLENVKLPEKDELTKLGAIQFEKIDSKNSSIKLSGATFEIRDKVSEKLIATVTTDKSGIGFKDELEIGDYYLIETIAPTNYKLENTRYNFSVTEDTTNSVYMNDKAIKNEKKVTDNDDDDDDDNKVNKLPKTGYDISFVLSAILISLGLLGVYILNKYVVNHKK